MQEFIKMVSAIKTDIEAMRSDMVKLTKTHSQKLSEEWIDSQQVLFILNISPRKLQTLRDNGTLPFSRIGGKIFFRTADVERLLLKGYTKRVTPTG